ncbi:HNH endonuclease [candidate division KSB1 bacterium]|nr:HNH endonuclease [candidate division KSB1 bacterium]
MAARAKHCCEYCRAPEIFFNHRFVVDHIVPRVFGGSDELDNLALACHSCNGHKYQKQLILGVVRKSLIRIFDPRRDRWGDHFRWNPNKTRLIGRSAIGRATIEALQLNNDRQVEARILWVKLNKF